MKRTIILLSICISASITAYGQAGASLTYDVRNDINQTNQYLLSLKNFSESVTQTSTLTDIWNFFKRSEQLLNKVSSTVSNIIYVQNIIQSQLNLIRWYGYYTDQAKRMKGLDLQHLTSFTNNMASLLKQSKANLEVADNLMKDAFFKMSDAERIQALRKVQEDIDANYAMMEIEYNRLYMRNQETEIKQYLRNY
jgi:hypothetical protein